MAEGIIPGFWNDVCIVVNCTNGSLTLFLNNKIMEDLNLQQNSVQCTSSVLNDNLTIFGTNKYSPFKTRHNISFITFLKVSNNDFNRALGYFTDLNIWKRQLTLGEVESWSLLASDNSGDVFNRTSVNIVVTNKTSDVVSYQDFQKLRCLIIKDL